MTPEYFSAATIPSIVASAQQLESPSLRTNNGDDVQSKLSAKGRQAKSNWHADKKPQQPADGALGN